MDPNDVNIEQCDKMASKSHKEHCGWNQIENWCPNHTHTIYCGTGMHFTIAVGSTLKNGAECIYMCTNSQNYQIWLVWSLNWHHGWIHIEKWCWMHIHLYQFPKLPNLVSLITKLTSQLNSHWKTVLNAYTFVSILQITKFG